MDNGDGDTLLGIGRALGATSESIAQWGSSIIKGIGSAIHDTLNGADNLDDKIVKSLWEATSKVIESTGHEVSSIYIEETKTKFTFWCFFYFNCLLNSFLRNRLVKQILGKTDFDKIILRLK